MPTFLIQLGHSPDISFAEIVAVNQRMGEPLQALSCHSGACFADAESEADVRTVCEELGGSVRFGECLLTADWSSSNEWPDHLEQTPRFQEALSEHERPVLGFSLFGDPSPLGGKKKVYGYLHDAAGRVKERLQAVKSSCRFVLPDPDGDGWTLTGAQVERNSLFKRGGELLLHADPEIGLTAALTCWQQDYEGFSHRDYGRPQRDARSGMLPPKLARMMLNLARTQETKSVIDPFCGSGGVLMEAALMGLTAVGIDRSDKAVNDAVANGEWLLSKFGLGAAPRAIQGDVRELRTRVEPLYFDACVSEPDLGPPLRRPLSESACAENINKLTELYRRALSEIRIVVKPGARVVFILPRFAVEGKAEAARINLLGDMKLMGYTLLDAMNGFQPSNARATLIYSRPKQFVQREIFVLQA